MDSSLGRYKITLGPVKSVLPVFLLLKVWKTSQLCNTWTHFVAYSFTVSSFVSSFVVAAVILSDKNVEESDAEGAISLLTCTQPNPLTVKVGMICKWSL